MFSFYQFASCTQENGDTNHWEVSIDDHFNTPNPSSPPTKPKKKLRITTTIRTHSPTISSRSKVFSDVASRIPRRNNNPLKEVEDASSNSSPSPVRTRKRRRASVFISTVDNHNHVSPVNVSHNIPLEEDDDASSLSPPLAPPAHKLRCVSTSSSDAEDGFIRSEQAEPAEQVRN